MKNLYIKTYGCQMNVYDSEKMAALLQPHGYRLHEQQDKADLIILNTCHIREKATEKVYSELGRLPEKATVVVAGCVAQAEGEEIVKRAKNVDIVVGPQSYQNLPVLLEKLKREQKWQIDLDFADDEKFDKLPVKNVNKSYASFLTVQEGCDKFCHFCCVPYTRGKEYSRPQAELVTEARQLVAAGTQEITLLGQNVSAYYNAGGLAALLQKLAQLDGVQRLRYLTSHPRDMTDEALFDLHANEPKLMPYLHLPVQSGSDSMLQAMNRKHTRDEYFAIIDKFTAARPDMAFSSDFIVGYPGETDADHADTLDLVRRVPFGLCYSFKYSPRPGTPAAVLTNQVPEAVKAQRLQELQELLQEKQMQFNKSCEGREFEVLFERKGKHDGQIMGKSPYLQAVVVQGDETLLGQIKKVRVQKAMFSNLQAEVL